MPGNTRDANKAGDYVAISAGRHHSCGVTANGDVDCWGSNEYGQLNGIPAHTVHSARMTGPFVEVSAGLQHSCAIRSNGVRVCWGDGRYGQAPRLQILPAALPSGQVGQMYASTQLALVDAGLQADGDYQPSTPAFALVTGALPNGLSLSANGVISGTPTVNGAFSFTVEGEDANRFVASRDYTLTIGACIGAGYTGTQLLWCQKICESGLSGRVLDTWIHRWISRYRDLPYCLATTPQS